MEHVLRKQVRLDPAWLNRVWLNRVWLNWCRPNQVGLNWAGPNRVRLDQGGRQQLGTPAVEMLASGRERADG